MAIFSPKDGKWRSIIPIEAHYDRKYKRIEVWIERPGEDHAEKVHQVRDSDGICFMYQAMPGTHSITVVTVPYSGSTVKERRKIEVV